MCVEERKKEKPDFLRKRSQSPYVPGGEETSSFPGLGRSTGTETQKSERGTYHGYSFPPGRCKEIGRRTPSQRE